MQMRGVVKAMPFRDIVKAGRAEGEPGPLQERDAGTGKACSPTTKANTSSLTLDAASIVFDGSRCFQDFDQVPAATATLHVVHVSLLVLCLLVP